MLSRCIILGGWFLLGSVVAQTSFNLTTVNPVDSTTCVAPSDYLACLASATLAEQNCINAAPNEAAQNGCGCGGFLTQMNCFASACWNRIYGCEYQSLVAGYVGLCEIETLPVPYWPAPDNAPGSCSCNTGKLIEFVLQSEASERSCETASGTTLSEIPAREEACVCCGSSMIISAMYDMCPNTDPKLIGLTALLNAVAPYYPWPNCGNSLNQFNCITDLDFTPPLSTGSVYNPTNLPASGTQTLTNIAGEVTSPASGSVFSYTAIGQVFTVTALSIDAFEATTTSSNSAANTGGGGIVIGGTATRSIAAGTTATPGTSTSGSKTGSSTSTGSVSTSPVTTTKSEAKKIALRLSSLLAPVILCGVVISL